MTEKPLWIIRWRWAFAAGSTLMLWSAAMHTASHDVTGYPWPSSLTLPILWLSALSITFYAVVVWAIAIRHRQRGR